MDRCLCTYWVRWFLWILINPTSSSGMKLAANYSCNSQWYFAFTTSTFPTFFAVSGVKSCSGMTLRWIPRYGPCQLKSRWAAPNEVLRRETIDFFTCRASNRSHSVGKASSNSFLLISTSNCFLIRLCIRAVAAVEDSWDPDAKYLLVRYSVISPRDWSIEGHIPSV